MSIRNIKGKAWVLAVTAATLRSEPIGIVIPRPCMLEVRLTEKTECHRPDTGHLKCTGFLLTVKPGCEELSITR